MGQVPSYPLRSVDHALQVLMTLQAGGVLTVGGTARMLGVGPSTAHRVLRALVHRDFAEQGPTREYRAGRRLGADPARRDPAGRLVSLAMTALTELVEQTGETAFLQVLRDRDVHFVATVESRQAVRVGDRTGLVLPAHMVSGGRAMLATMSDEDVVSLYAGSRLVADARSLRRTLAEVRDRGYGTNVAETHSGFVALGVAVTGSEDHARCAVSLGVPEFRYDQSHLPDHLAALRRAASSVTRLAAGGG